MIISLKNERLHFFNCPVFRGEGDELMTTANNIKPQGTLGHVCWYSVPNMTVGYDEIQALATSSGFNLDFVPKLNSPAKQLLSAWEKATNLGTRGKKIALTIEAQRELFKIYDAVPNIRLKVQSVGNDSRMAKRQLIAIVTMPTSDSDDVGGQASTSIATKQLNFPPIYLLEFDKQEMATRRIPLKGESHPVIKLIESQVQDILTQIQDDYIRYRDNCDDKAIRSGMRAWLQSVYALNARPSGAQGGGGGVYFVPCTIPSEDIDAAQKYINGLSGIASSHHPDGNATLTILPAYRNGEGYEPAFAEDMERQSHGQIMATVKEITQDLKELKKSKGKNKIRKAAGIVVASERLNEGVKAYQATFESDLFVSANSAKAVLQEAIKSYQEALKD
jgi:hypothetical protein